MKQLLIILFVLVSLGFGNTHLQKSLKHIKQKEYAQAIENINSYLKSNPDNLQERKKAYQYLGYSYQRLYQFQEAIISYEQLLNYAKTPSLQSQIYNNLALCYQELGDFNRSIATHQKALQLKKSIDTHSFDTTQMQKHQKSISHSYNNIGELYRMQRKYDYVLEPYQKALYLRKKYLGEEHLLTTESYSLIASFYSETGDYKEGRKYLHKSIEICKKHGYSSLKDNYQDLGRNYQKSGEPLKALKYYQKSLDLRRNSTQIRDQEWRGGAYLYMAQIYNDQNQSKKAMEYAKRALEQYQNVFGFENSNIATTYQTLATIYFNQHDYKQSLHYNQKALEIRQKLFVDNIDVADSYYYLSRDFLHLKAYQKATHHTLKSFELFMKNQNAHYLVLTNEQKRSYNQHYGARAKFSNLFEIAYYYLDSLDSNSLEYQKFQQKIFNRWLSFKGRVSNREDTIAQLYQKIGKLKSNIEELKATKTRLSTLYKTYPNGHETHKIEQLQKSIQTAKAKKRTLELELNRSDKIFKELLALQHIEYQDIMSRLKPNQLYIDFARAKHQYYIFTIDKTGKITFNRVSPKDTQSIEANIQAFREINQKIADGKDSKIERAKSQKYLGSIYQVLIEKYLHTAIASKEFLIISPDGLLNFLPFEALYDSHNYLIEKRNISYIPSAKHLLFNQRAFSHQPPQANDIVVFAHPNYNMGMQQNRSEVVIVSLGDSTRRLVDFNRYYEDLEGSLEEMEWIEKLYGKRVTTYQNDSATAQNLFKISSPNILHISTHGFFLKQISNESLMQSGLLLAGANRAKFDKNTTGIVSAFELSNLNLADTNLVVLSACDTGLGKIENAEGVVGLPKAFIQAGAKNIIMSLWSVNDAKTATLMKKFYTHLHNDKNQDYIKALRKAKLEMIKEHPYYWSGFILSGI